MSETAQLGPAGTEVHEASPPVAFEVFFQQEGDWLYRALWLVTRNQFEAEELTQEAFVRVLERGREGRRPSPADEALTSGSMGGRWRTRTSDRSLVRRVLYL
jgi:Sigma-70 region 2